jgi:hypothetical protein
MTYMIVHLADSTYLPWNEANEHSLSLSSLLLLMPCRESKPDGRQFFAEILIKRLLCSTTLCLLCCMLPTRRLELMINSSSLICFIFHLIVLFGFNFLFPHILSVVQHNSIEKSWFPLTIHERNAGSVLTMHFKRSTCSDSETRDNLS